MALSAARNLKSLNFEILSLNEWTFKINQDDNQSFDHLDDVDEDVDGGVDGKHQVVALGQDLSPGRPEDELTIDDHLVK